MMITHDFILQADPKFPHICDRFYCDEQCDSAHTSTVI